MLEPKIGMSSLSTFTVGSRDVINTGWAETKTETSYVETEAETETSRVYQKFTNISTVEEVSC
jgi:hypothetical protein